MSQEFLTVDEAARRLDVHSRTVLRFIRQGKLKAAKVGRQWRIRPDDLKKLTGEPVKSKRATVSSVLDIPVSGREEADRLQTTVMASLNSRRGRGSGADIRVDSLYNEAENSLRFILWGDIAFMKDFFTLMDMQKTK